MINLVAVGDIALVEDYSTSIEKEGVSFLFSLIAPVLKERDIVFGNLEAPLSNQGCRDRSKPVCFCGSPEGVGALVSAGFTHVSLANNHAYDYGAIALKDTQKRLAQAGIATVGVGRDLADSRRPLIQSFSGGTLALLAYNAYTTNGRYYARRKKEGVAPLEYHYISEDIRSLRKRYNPLVIVVSLHWGVEGNHYPTPFQRYLAHQIIEDGANLILGHHPHVIQGIEQYKNGVIVYSLGNFCFPDIASQHIVKGLGVRQQPENRESFIFRCEVTPDGVESYEVIPIYINQDFQPCLSCGQRRSNLLEQIARYSGPLSSANYEEFYREEIGNKGGYVSRLSSLFKQEGFSGLYRRFRLGYLRTLTVEFQNYVREAHHRRWMFQKIAKDRKGNHE